MTLKNKQQNKHQNKRPNKQLSQKILTLVFLLTCKIAFGASQDDVVIAIVDTGLDFNNPELSQFLWTNPGESGLDAKGKDKSKNGIDDDGNGFIDDLHGWDFVEQKPEAQDHHGHGSHIAGLVLSQIKQLPQATHVRLMILKYYDQTYLSTDTLGHTIKAFRYATSMGAHIINYSGGGSQPNRAEYLALQEAQEKGLLLVAAAGNEGRNLSHGKFFPANYPLGNIISITAVDSFHELLKTSNFSDHFVDLAAPGKNQISWLPGSHLGPMTGTSQATALATGAAASFLLQRPEFKFRAEDLIRYLKAGAQNEKQLIGKVQNAAFLNEELPPLLRDSGESPFGFSIVGTTPSSAIEQQNSTFQKLTDKN